MIINTSFWFNSKNKSTTEPSGIGTLEAIPSNFPFKCGNTFPTALAAPVEVGMIFSAAALLLRKSEWGTSANRWSLIFFLRSFAHKAHFF